MAIFIGGKIMTALERVQKSTVDLETSIDNAISVLGNLPNNDAALNAVADSLDAQKKKVDDAVTALTTG